MLCPLVLLLVLAADGPVPPIPTPGAGTGTQGSGGPVQRSSQPLPVRPIESEDEAARNAKREYLAAEQRRRGPDGNRDEILNRTRLQPVDSEIEDRSALDVSLRTTQPEMLAMPMGFSRVYVDPANPDRYVRANGALFVTFPFSEYKRTKKGTKAEIPAGTSFRIGMPAHYDMPERPSPFAGAAPERIDQLYAEDRQREMRVNTRLDMYRGDGRTEPAPGPRSVNHNERRDEQRDESVLGRESALPAILTDEAYRRDFFESLRKRPTTGKSSAAR